MKNKIIVAVIALVMTFSPIMQPVKTAYAFPVIDISHILISIVTKIILPALETAVKKQILDRLVDQIITAIQGGGKPKFVTDWRGFLEEAGQGAAGDFAKEAGLGFLCSPFSLQVQLNLLPVKKFSQQAQCTLDQIVSNVRSFYNDFRAGGWIAYGTAWEPQNNFFGVSLLAALESERRQGLAKEAAYNEANAYKGFLGVRDKNGNIVTPGSTVGDVVSTAVGSGIPFLLSGDDVGDYAGAIVNAMVNRLFTAGLAAVQPSSSQQSIDAANAAYEASVIANAFNPAKNNLLSTINSTAIPRGQARSLIDSTITNLNKFKTDLAKISADLTATGKGVCSGGIVVANVKSQIASDIAQADVDIAKLQTERADNQIVLAPLDAAIAEINQLTPSRASLNRLDAINYEVTPMLDETAANAFKFSIQTETDAINQNIAQKTAAFNQQLAVCLQN